MKILMSLLAIAGAVGAGALAGQEPASKELVAVRSKDIRWEKKEGMPAGLMVCHLWGEASGGAAVDLMKFAAGTKVPLHWHSPNHVVTVLSGTLVVGTSGNPGDPNGKEIGAGGYYRIPAKTPHWTMAKEETVIQVSGDAPNDVHMVEAK